MNRSVSWALIAMLLVGCGAKNEPGKVSAYKDRPDMWQVANDDPEMEAARVKSQQTLPHFLSLLKNASGDDDARVEAAFRTVDDGIEYLWVDQLEYHENQTYSGRISVKPASALDLKEGDPVTFKSSQIDDWLFIHNGKYEGGFVADIARKRMGQKLLAR